VVFPCVPATATPYFMRINSASISARWITGISRWRAATSSTLSGATAEERTTTSASPTCSAWWPMATGIPREVRRRVFSDSRLSEPVTTYPRLCSTSAMPLMPMPPMPTK